MKISVDTFCSFCRLIRRSVSDRHSRHLTAPSSFFSLKGLSRQGLPGAGLGVGLARKSALAMALAKCLVVGIVVVGSIGSSGCGKIGDPLPPLPRAPLVVEDLTVAQEGTRLVLRFPLVRSRLMRGLERLDIYRVIEPPGAPEGMTPERFGTIATLIASIPAEEIPLNRSTASYVDRLEPRQAAAESRYRYALRIVTRSGGEADLSNYATIIPLLELALAPGRLAAGQQERAVELSWEAPTANLSGRMPANIAGYNLYRRVTGGVQPMARLNESLLTETRFEDRGFEFGVEYEYEVRAVSRASAGTVESDASGVLSHRAADTFAPQAPGSITIASIGRMVSLFWPLNSEPDVAGYNVYRAEDGATPPEQWRRLNAQPLRSGSFRDDRVVAGREYFYQITAVDRAGNESRRSTTVSETVSP